MKRVLAIVGIVGAFSGVVLVTHPMKAYQAANPPAMLQCSDGVHDCTLTVVVPVTGSVSMRTCPEGNYDTMLNAVRYERGIQIFFSCDPSSVYLVHQAWEYEENDLVLSDGRPVELSEVKHVKAMLPGFIERAGLGPFDVFDATERR